MENAVTVRRLQRVLYVYLNMWFCRVEYWGRRQTH